jgi:hypothetical protein
MSFLAAAGQVSAARTEETLKTARTTIVDANRTFMRNSLA